MFDTAAQLLQDGHCPLDVGLLARDKTEQLAFLRGANASTHRTFDKRSALPRHGRADPLHRIGTYRAHVDHEFADEIGFQNPISSTVDSLACYVIQKHHDHGFTAVDKLRRAGEQFCACRGQRPCLRRIAVPDPDFMPNRHQPLRDRCSHSSSSACANLHLLTSLQGLVSSPSALERRRDVA